MLNRRKFLGLGLGAIAVAAIPSSLSAEDFRASKPKAWTATKVDDAVKQIFGTTTKFMEQKGLQSNIKKLNEEKTKKTETLAALTKKNADMKTQYEKLKAEKKIKTVYLTFDDGPSGHTDQILEILKKNNIKATFFVIGVGKNFNDYKKIIDNGHAIGLHTFSHDYKEVYTSEESFFKDLYKISWFPLYSL